MVNTLKSLNVEHKENLKTTFKTFVKNEQKAVTL